jgi:hypothetical protein
MEREDKTSVTESLISTKAFDGNVVRTLGQSVDGPIAFIDSAETGHFSNANRLEPFAFLFEYINEPYSQLIQTSPDCRVSSRRYHDTDGLEVSFVHPKFLYMRFVLVLDEKYRLVQRDEIMQRTGDKEPRLYERHEFTDYKAYDDPSGEQIWFPSHALYRYYMGNMPDGSPVNHTTKQIEITSLEFNVNIPDDVFTLDIPKNARVYDRLTGRGWLDKEPARMAHSASRTRSNLWLIGAGIALPLFIIALYYLRRRMHVA